MIGGLSAFGQAALLMACSRKAISSGAASASSTRVSESARPSSGGRPSLARLHTTLAPARGPPTSRASYTCDPKHAARIARIGEPRILPKEVYGARTLCVALKCRLRVRRGSHS